MNRPKLHDFMGSAYERSRRVAHQRRATLIDPPSVSLYVCVYRPGRWKETFRPFLRAIVDQLNDAEPGSPEYPASCQKIEAFVQGAYRHYDITPASTPPPGASGLTCEFRDRYLERGVWRVEVLRQYVAITLHVGVDLEPGKKSYVVRLRGRAADGSRGVQPQADVTFDCPWVKRISGKRWAAPRLAQVLFKDLVDDLERRFDSVMEQIDRVYGTLVGQGPALAPLDRSENRVFAALYSIAVPWTVLRDADPDPDLRRGVPEQRPVFPDFDAPGIPANEVPTAVRQANAFLTQHWNTLRSSLISENESDCVACYMLNGHVLYVSSLGSETDDPYEPVKYLLLYGVEPEAGSKPPRGVSVRTPCNFAWRLSRFISRVHDIGAARLRALGHHEEISRFLLGAKELEFKLANSDPKVVDNAALRALEDDFLRITRVVQDGDQTEVDGASITVPIPIRASRVKQLYATMTQLSQDLGIIALPSYQPYDQFIRRRIVEPMERMTGALEKYNSLVQRLSTANLALQRREATRQTKEILGIQEIADVVGALVFAYYAMQFYHYAREHWGLLEGESHDSPAVLVGLAAAVLVGLHTWRSLGKFLTGPFTGAWRWIKGRGFDES